MDLTNNFIDQALMMANNHLCTGRPNKAIQLVNQIRKIDPDNEVVFMLMEAIAAPAWDRPMPDLSRWFGVNWLGDPLDGKSIQVICDQGMGDTINCLRYLHWMKQKWNCKIHLNCYAFYKEFERLITLLDYVDSFSAFPTKCDYHTNILSIPALMSGLHYDVYYPAHWQDVMEKPIPSMPKIENVINVYPDSDKSFKVGVAHKSNSENAELAARKTVPIGCIAMLEDGVNELWSIIPDTEKYNMMIQPSLKDLLDTASVISGLDVVVSVDTVTLHLAGAMGIKTLGLLPHQADARWALEPNAVWYPSIELFRQGSDLNWEVPVRQIKERLVSLRHMS
jgi:hypothetical protein